ncbi:tetratricopeptide repeat protein [Amphibacillus sediminis]|uniref:tetratricopeptide repeat protein n=1 Tax=Amphibacillus sediminis TaxID=360185 RepID=UPI00083385A9|nr:tetratricopeptide repeat protein [Amphibacillus sediminis]
MNQIYQAVQLIENDQVDQALTILKQYKSKATEEEQFSIADLYLELGLLEEARELLLNLLASNPNDGQIMLTLAEIYIESDQDQEALDLLTKIDVNSDDYLPALLTTADLYQSQGLYEVAEQKLIEAKQLAPQETLIDFALGELAFSNGEYQKAVTYYQKVYQSSSLMVQVDIALRLAEAYATIGEFEQALHYYQEAEKEEADVLFRYGFVATRLDRFDIAVHAWEEVLKQDPEFVSVYPLLAKAYEETGQIEEGYELAETGIKLDPLNKELLLIAARLAQRCGFSDQSYRYAREAISIDPGFKEAVLYLVENYRRDSDFQAIIDLLTHIIEQGEEDGYYKWELAKAYEAEELYDQALSCYQDAYHAFKDDGDFLKSYGYFLVEEGKMKEAMTIFNRYLAIEPSDTEIETYLARLND